MQTIAVTGDGFFLSDPFASPGIQGERSILQQVRFGGSMPFDVHFNSDFSFGQLCDLAQAGHSVVKTPHVGNVYPNNLLTARAGLTLVFYDRTIGLRDSNFHPHRIIRNGRAETISCGTKLTSHAVVDRDCGMPEFKIGRKVVDCHMSAMRNAIPTSNCEIYSDYLLRNVDVVMPLLELATRLMPSIWEFEVTKQGDRVRLPHTVCRQSGLRREIFGVTNQECGLLIPNILNVLVLGSVEALRVNHQRVYHLSGPDMVRYIGGMQSNLHQLYDGIRCELRLPHTLEFYLVPVAGVRLAGDARMRSRVDELVDAWLTLNGGNADRAARIQNSSTETRRAVIVQCAEQKFQEIRRFQEAAVATDGVFYDITLANCFNQHDMVAGQELYVHPWAMEAPIHAVDAMISEGERQRLLFKKR